MGHYAKMLHAHLLAITTLMPIPEQVRKPDSVIAEEMRKLKQDRTEFRAPWLDRLPTPASWRSRVLTVFTGHPCANCMLGRIVILYVIIALLLIF